MIVLGLLLAVALPNFFGASTAAQDSAARQYLTIAYHDLKSAQATNEGVFPSSASLVSAAASAEPQLTFVSGLASGANLAKMIVIERTGANGLRLGTLSASTAICVLTADSSTQYAPVISGCTGSGGSGSGFTTPANTSPPILTGNATDGQTQSVSNGSWSGSAPSSYGYAWQRSTDGGTTWTAISGQTAAVYTLSSTDIDKLVRAQVTPLAVDGSALTSAVSATAVGPVSPYLVSTGSGSLTVSGNEITDATRAANTQGDGRGYFTVTNLVPNGGFESNTTGWAGFNGGSISRATNESKFGSASLKVISTINGDSTYRDFSGLTPGATYTASFWIKGTSGAQSFSSVESPIGTWVNYFASADASMTHDGTWRFYKATFVAASAGTARLVLGFSNSAAQIQYIDGVQLESGDTANSYVETSGGAATAVQGSPDSSTGIYEATTNLVTNGGFETNTTGWANGSATISRDATQAKFGSASGRFVSPGSTANEYISYLTSTLTAGVTYTAS